MAAIIIYARVTASPNFLYRLILQVSKFQFSKISTKLLEIKSREYSKRVQRIKMLPIHVFISIFFNADAKNHIFEKFIIFWKFHHFFENFTPGQGRVRSTHPLYPVVKTGDPSVFIQIFFNAEDKHHMFQNFLIFLKILHRARGECGAPTLFTRW